MRAAVLALGVVLSVAMVGCAAMQPGQGLDRRFPSNWGCSYNEVAERAERLAADLPDGKMYTPQVGWTACDVLAHNGQPDRVDTQTSAYSRSASWWYDTAEDMNLISLERQGGEWVVTYVGM